MVSEESTGKPGASASSNSGPSSQLSPTATSASERQNTADGGPNTQHDVPYTITQEDHHLKVDFVSGPQQGDSFRLDMRDLAAARDRWEARAQARADDDETSEDDEASEDESPLRSPHETGGNQISEEEDRRPLAAELAQKHKQKAEENTAPENDSRKSE